MSRDERKSFREKDGWSLLVLLAITGLGFWLRWLYVRDVSFFVDEYLTLGAAYKILAQGVPLLPSGNFYSHGLLLSYIEAALVGLGADQVWLLRLPPLLLSTSSIPLLYWMGRRMVSPVAGLIAATMLAVSPESILWGGRVRMYAPLQFFVLFATAMFYLWVVREKDRPAFRLLFVGAYCAAIFCHAEAMLLLPIWGLWALAQRGWRWAFRLPNLVAFGLCGLSIVAEILLRRIGPPVQAWLAPGVFEPVSRQYLSAGFDWAGISKAVGPIFGAPETILFSALALAGPGYLLLSRRRAGKLVETAERRAVAYLYALLLPVLAALLFAVDASWKSPRYLLMLLPHFFLSAAALLVWLGRWLQARSGQRLAWLGTIVTVSLIVLGSWPSALAATRESVPAYDWAFGYVKDHQQPGDLVVTFLCPAALQHLGRCDYLAIPEDYEGFAYLQGERWVSGWDNVPILDSAAGLSDLLHNGNRVWFVVDEGRFDSRYPEEFLQSVWDGMEVVAAQREMLIFRSLDAPGFPASAYKSRRIDFEDGVSVVGYARAPEAVEPGQDLALLLRWEARSRVSGTYTAFVHLLDEQGEVRAQIDRLPFNGRYSTAHWKPGPTLPDRYTLPLPIDLAPGRYRLAAGLYDAISQERLPVLGGEAVLDYLWIGPRPRLIEPQVRLEASFGDRIRLLGYDLSPGTTLTVTLYWESVGPIDKDYTVFLHLVNKDGQIQAQGDGPPLGGTYPTSFWEPGEVLKDVHAVASGTEASAGTYRLLVGLYTLEDGVRLPVTVGPSAGGDSVVLVWPDVAP